MGVLLMLISTVTGFVSFIGLIRPLPCLWLLRCSSRNNAGWNANNKLGG